MWFKTKFKDSITKYWNLFKDALNNYLNGELMYLVYTIRLYKTSKTVRIFGHICTIYMWMSVVLEAKYLIGADDRKYYIMMFIINFQDAVSVTVTYFIHQKYYDLVEKGSALRSPVPKYQHTKDKIRTDMKVSLMFINAYLLVSHMIWGTFLPNFGNMDQDLLLTLRLYHETFKTKPSIAYFCYGVHYTAFFFLGMVILSSCTCVIFFVLKISHRFLIMSEYMQETVLEIILDESEENCNDEAEGTDDPSLVFHEDETHQNFIHNQMVKCIEMHVENREYFNMLSNITNIMLPMYIFMILVVAPGIIIMLMSNGVREVANIRLIGIAIWIYTVLVIACSYCQHLRDGSEEFYETLCEINWYQFNQENQKDFLILLHNAQQFLNVAYYDILLLDRNFIIRFFRNVHSLMAFFGNVVVA